MSQRTGARAICVKCVRHWLTLSVLLCDLCDSVVNVTPVSTARNDHHRVTEDTEWDGGSGAWQNRRMAEVLLLGDARLRLRSHDVARFGEGSFQQEVATLHATLGAFRRQYGFGRAISAPQIGIPLRVIAVNLGKEPFTIVNPAVTGTSSGTFTMWDDCMSFPDLLVRVRRNESISLEYADENGKPQVWRDLDLPAAELLQHEIDHLDGVLAVDRAIDRDSLVVRAEFERDPVRYSAMVDYTIGVGWRTGSR